MRRDNHARVVVRRLRKIGRFRILDIERRTRQSRPASATDGMTLIFGGSPTPDRIHVTEIVDFWIAFVNVFAANVPMLARMTSTRSRP